MKTSLTALFFIIVLAACTGQSVRPTYESKFLLSVERQSEFKSLLDDALRPHGLYRFGAAPGLDELIGRKVFYVEYRPNIEAKLAYITVTDVINQDTMDVRIYPEGLPSKNSGPAALASVQNVLAKYQAILQPRQPH